ncbi:MAG: nitroreductase family protein [Albidovulum sp.]|nr:nitroreductase family protein [Albidovulum sp.]MDE0534038.1 nitroreductase family protein [Albidovulum sp.]
MKASDNDNSEEPIGQAVELPEIGSRESYDTLMEVVRNRVTVRKFDADFIVPESHFELILEAARHAPSGANAQPWHFIVVEDSEIKQRIADYFVAEQRFRAKAKMKFPTPDYRGLATAPGFIVVCSDLRWVEAFPVMKEESPDNAELNRMYRENAERILIQSVAASTMCAHLAAASLGYCVWWVTAIGQENAQKAMRPLLGIPDEISVLDIFLFGPPAQEPYKRWKKSMSEIASRGEFDPAQCLTRDEITEWIKKRRHKVMFRDASRID